MNIKKLNYSGFIIILLGFFLLITEYARNNNVNIPSICTIFIGVIVLFDLGIKNINPTIKKILHIILLIVTAILIMYLFIKR